MIVTGETTADAIKLAERLANPGDGKRALVLEAPYDASLRELFFDWQVISEGTLGGQGLYHARICPAPSIPMTDAQWIRGADISH